MIEITYPLHEISCLDVWEIIYEYLQNQDFFSIDLKVDLNGKKMTIDRVRDVISKISIEHFNVRLSEIDFRFIDIIGSNYGFICVKNESDSIKFDWSDLVNRFYKEEKFIQAWLSDIEYELLQNAKNILQYKLLNKPYEHLPMKHNGKQPPLGRDEIDTSKNPGRRIIKESEGYIEAIGAKIWLGDEFWERVGTKKETIMETFSKELEVISDSLIKLTFQENLFTENSDKELQDKIRRVLFNVNTSNKWFGLFNK